MLKEILKKLLASEYAFVIKTQFFHWNVEGPDFVQLHQLFNTIYDDVYGAVDPTAEYIRTLDDYAPGSFERFAELSEISGQTRVPRARLMIEELLADSEKMIALLNQCFDAAESEDQQGIANFIAERIDAHGKWRWQLRSCVRDQRA